MARPKKIRLTPVKSPCPPTGPAHDGRGRGVGMQGGSRRGARNHGRGGEERYRAR